MKNEINVINGSVSVDGRGAVSFANDFEFKNVKRFYIVENFSNKIIRAFQGHLKEADPVMGQKYSVAYEVISLQLKNKVIIF